MRTLYSRSDWQPRTRIEGLRRYAFIGDSMTFGAGVAPDESLPACAERQMNSACLETPVEAVNFGVSGYNIWNSWFDFKNAPQVYDGVVLTVCTNDSEMFGRTYRTAYNEPNLPMWEESHFCGYNIVRGFEEMARFSKKNALPIAICFYYLWDFKGTQRVCRILSDLCAAHGFPFIDSMVAIAERNFARDSMVISECDPHPSVIVHEAVGRHLVRTLERHQWFGGREAAPMDTITERILASARAMSLADHYPPDVIHRWAIRTLGIKLHHARRLQALSSETDDLVAASGVHADLVAGDQSWHVSQRVSAFLDELSTVNQPLFWCLIVSEEERLKLGELASALEAVDRPGFSEVLKEIPVDLRDSSPGELPDTPELIGKYLEDLDGTREALLAIRDLPALKRMLIASDDLEFRLRNLDVLLGLIDRVRRECLLLKESAVQIAEAMERAAPSLNKDDAETVSNLRDGAIKRAHQSFSLIHVWRTKAEKIRDPERANYTTIEVAVRSPAAEGKTKHCFVSVRAEYHAPNRLPSQDDGRFLCDGTAKFVKLYLPLLYTGRVFVRIHHAGARAEFELLKVEVYNLPHERKQLSPAQFLPQPAEWLASSPIYLY
jgi:hypothetical protein